jgi:hypothetical protein
MHGRAADHARKAQSFAELLRTFWEDPGVETSTRSTLYGLGIRMVVPIRREFHIELDVGRMLSDPAYARAVITAAMGSQDERLRSCAQAWIDRRQGGLSAARTASAASTASPDMSAAALRSASAAASRALVDAIGPQAQTQAIRLERARGPHELAALVDESERWVATLRGAAAAQAFRAKLAATSEKAAPEPIAPASAVDVRRHGARAAQGLLARLGPRGNALALQMHGACDADALMHLVQQAHATLESLIGTVAAQAYLADVAAATHE